VCCLATLAMTAALHVHLPCLSVLCVCVVTATLLSEAWSLTLRTGGPPSAPQLAATILTRPRAQATRGVFGRTSRRGTVRLFRSAVGTSQRRPPATGRSARQTRGRACEFTTCREFACRVVPLTTHRPGSVYWGGLKDIEGAVKHCD
jgi:hypothetical protein